MDTLKADSIAQWHDVTPLLGMLACPDCKAQSLEISGEEQMRCRNCGGQYFSDNGIPVLFKNGHPSESVEYLIRKNMEDTIHFLGEDYYKRRGHDKYLIRALGARAGEIILDLGCGHGHISQIIWW